MPFDSRSLNLRPGDIFYQDRFKTVEMAIGFSKLTCQRCQFAAIYKYRIQQIRRRPEIITAEGEEIRPDHQEIWSTIPRYAEIPETIRCKRCREVIGLYTKCIF